MKRRWMAYTTWRIQQAARLRSMSDWELKDIGLTRSNITDAVRGQALRGRAATGPSRWPLEPIKSQQLMSKQSTLAILAHIVRYWHKADIPSALHMSAFDPKRRSWPWCFLLLRRQTAAKY